MDVVVRADATLAKPELYEALEKLGVKYAARTGFRGATSHTFTEETIGLLQQKVFRNR